MFIGIQKFIEFDLTQIGFPIVITTFSSPSLLWLPLSHSQSGDQAVPGAGDEHREQQHLLLLHRSGPVDQQEPDDSAPAWEPEPASQPGVGLRHHSSSHTGPFCRTLHWIRWNRDWASICPRWGGGDPLCHINVPLALQEMFKTRIPDNSWLWSQSFSTLNLMVDIWTLGRNWRIVSNLVLNRNRKIIL